MKSLAPRYLGTLAVAALTAACGSASVTAETFQDPQNAGDAATTDDTSIATGDTTTGGDADRPPPGKDTGGDPPPPADTKPTEPPLTIDNACERLAEQRCTSAFSACCTTEGYAVKEGACKTEFLATCSAQVKEIKGGKGTFNPAAFGACAAGLNTLNVKCNTPILEYLKTIAPCDQLFNGWIAPGSSCGEAWQCKVPEGSFASCNRDGRCEAIAIVGLDKMCTYSGSTRAICDYGFQCAFASGTFSGTCRVAKALGGPCNSSTECGFGNYCERGLIGGGKCIAGLAAGASCGEGAQCASGNCPSGKCTDPMVAPVEPRSCNGAG